MPGSFSPKEIAFSQDIDYAEIEKAVTQLNEDFIKTYETKF